MSVWQEAAIAVRRSQGEPQILCEGTLAAVILTLALNRVTSLQDLRVSLPDRRAPPFEFTGKALSTLLDDPLRPQTKPLQFYDLP